MSVIFIYVGSIGVASHIDSARTVKVKGAEHAAGARPSPFLRRRPPHEDARPSGGRFSAPRFLGELCLPCIRLSGVEKGLCIWWVEIK